MKMLRIWDMLQKFRCECKRRGWVTSENEDWVGADNCYHSFVWTKNLHSSSFKKIALNSKCVIREGLSYRVTSASYTAWLLSETPQETIAKILAENLDFLDRIALYDLSPVMEGKNYCNRINQTDSSVFQEFESFLESEFKVKMVDLQTISARQVGLNHCLVA